MKKIFFILTILVSVSSYSNDSFHIGISTIDITKLTNNEYRLTFSVTAPELALDLAADTPCFVPNEVFRITGSTRETGLRERDLLFARTDIDLNGDSDFDDIFNVKKTGKKLFIGGHGPCPVTGTAIFNGYRATPYLDSKGNPRFCRIGSRGPPFLVRSFNQRSGIITMALGTQASPLSMLTLPNPHVRVSITAITETTRSGPKYKIQGEKTRHMFSNEKLFEDQGGNWVSIIWCAKPVQAGQSVFTIKLRGISPPFIISIEPNISIEKGILLRGSKKKKSVLR